MKTKIIICLAALLGVAAVDAVKTQLEVPKARLTIKVLDERGVPVSGADVQLGFRDGNGREDITVRDKTDQNGLLSAEGYSNSSVGCNINKEGYYMSGAPIHDFEYNKIDRTLNRWLPWDATYQSILRPIGRLVPLYAKTTLINVPIAGQPCGYDLQKGDWVVPYGIGQVADFVITAERHYENIQDFEVKIELKFSQRADGIQEAKMPEFGRYSVFKWEREAPTDDYQSIIGSLLSHKNDRFDITAKENQNYFFRVRTASKNGHIISAFYGKIKGGLFLDATHAKICKIRLTYYLNPTSLDRNLEWDPTKNLIPGLKPEETPREP